MKTINQLLKASLILCLIMLVSCKVKTGTDESSRFKILPLTKGAVSFSSVKNNILVPQCASCHSWAANEAEVAKRIVPGQPEKSDLFIQVDSGSMPLGQPRLPQSFVDMLRNYIVEFRAPPPLPQDPTDPPEVKLEATYSSLKVHLFDKSCVGCHRANGRLVNLSDPQVVRRLADDILYSITEGRENDDMPMPPLNSKAPVPTKEVIEAFRTWIDNQMPD